MQNLEKIRFVAVNYPHIKGLQMAVLGLFVVAVALWSNQRQGDLTLLTILLPLVVILAFLVERYYKRSFGQVRIEPQTRRQNIGYSVVFGLLGLAAFVLDTTDWLPISLIGIVFALGLGFDYWRFNRPVQEKFLTYYPWFAAGLLVVSILPAFRLQNFWATLGFTNAISGVMTVTGVLMVILGILSHLFLMRAFPPQAEADNDERI